MKIMHLLSSNKFSGAENVACQIISLFGNDEDVEMCYCSPHGEIDDVLKEKKINFLQLKKFSVSEVKRAIKQFQPDIIHAHDIKAICMALLAGCKSVVGQIHRNHPKFRKISLRSVVFNHFAKKKALKSIIWVTDSCFEDYVFNSSVKGKSVILKNIIDISSLTELAEQDGQATDSDIVFVGRIIDVKNPLRLIEISKLVMEKLPNLRLHIVGSGDLEDELKAAIHNGAMQDNVKLLGFKANPFGELAKSKIFLLTSKTEGLPMSILEAQAFGLPVVCPKIAGLENVIIQGQTGYLYSTDDDAKKFIVELLQSPEKLNTMRENVLKFSAAYNDKTKYKNSLSEIYFGR